MKSYTNVIYTLLISTFCLFTPLFAQPGGFPNTGDRIAGIITDASTKEPLIGAGIRLKSKTDSNDVHTQQTNERGMFRFSGLKSEKYVLEVVYLGYHTAKMEVSTRAERPFYKVEMQSQSTSLKTITIEEKAPLAVQRRDTTEYNANAYKVHKDATTEDLISKMPGITNDNGTVKAQGEEVKKVLLDGKPFFGDDPNAAIKNLPAEVVERVQVFDQLSDQSQFTGFNDGNTNKTINIVTRPNKRNGLMAKLYGGYGKDEDMKTDRYQSGLNINKFKGDQRISLLGMFNNVNQQNFNIQDLFGMMGGGNAQMQRMGQIGSAMGMSPGMMMRGGGGGPGGDGGGIGNFMIGQQNGISKTLAGGLNYNDKFFNRLQVSLSYFYNNGKNNNLQDVNRKYILQNDSQMVYNQYNPSETDNINHRFNARLEYTIDSFNSVLLTPRITFQDNTIDNVSQAITTKVGEKLNTSYSQTNSTNQGYTFSNDVLLRHKFLKVGRTISLNINTQLNDRTSNSKLFSDNTYYADSITQKWIHQNAKTITSGHTYGTSLSYTEPISATQQLQFTYTFSDNVNSSDKNTHKYDSLTAAFDIKDTLLSNTFTNEYITHREGAAYRIANQTVNASFELNYQQAFLKGHMTQPYTNDLSRSYVNVLPAVQVQYTFKNKSNVRFNYRTSTNAPSVSQMQQVIDNSNPLSITVGNPDLNQSYAHSMFLRYNYTNSVKANTFFAFVSFNQTLDYIGNSTNINSMNGSQRITYKNLSGYRSINSFFTYGLPIKKIKSTLNMNLGVNHTRIPSLINGQENFSEATALVSGFVLSSNISERLDFTLGYTPTYNFSVNTIQKSLNNNYFNHNSSLRLNWYFLSKTFINTEVRELLYAGLSSSYNQQFTLWSGSIGQKFLPMNAGEIKFTVFDILHQNNAISRTISDTYIEDVKSLVLQRYYMVTLTINFRRFKQ